MPRVLIGALCSLSLLFSTAATAITVHSHRAPHRVVYSLNLDCTLSSTFMKLI